MTTRCHERTLGLALAVATLLACAGPAAAQVSGPIPDELEDVGVDQNLDAQVPLDLKFVDENGHDVTLGDYFHPDRPVILNLVYFRCPMLCNLVLDGMVGALREIDWVPGREFEIVSVSIDPLETPTLARNKKQNYIASYGRPAAAAGWHFLTGRPEAIAALTDAVGFRYQYVEERKEFAHPAVLSLLTPEGRISRYLFGIRQDPRTLRLSLVETSEGKIGSVLDQFVLYCSRYDSESGKYSTVAWKLMQVGGIATLLILGGVLLSFWLREARSRKRVA